MEENQEKTYDFTDYHGSIGREFFMDDINKNVDQLIQSIKESELYRNYQYCEQQLAQDPGLKEQIDRYRVSAYHMSLSEQEDLYEESDILESKYEQLRKNPKVNAYLEAELALCRVLQKISVRIDSEVGLIIPEV